MFYSVGGGLWYSQKWYRYSCNEYYETGVDYEVRHPGGYGGYHRHLRVGRLRFDWQQKYVTINLLSINHYCLCRVLVDTSLDLAG